MPAEENLERLLSEVTKTCGPDASSAAIASRVAAEIPLTHSTSVEKFLAVCAEGALLSQSLLVAKGILPSDADTIERRLGTENDIFTYCGPAGYRGKDLGKGCAFIFAPALEAGGAARAKATPFDSGGIVNYYRPSASRSQQREYLREHELPVPEYRTLLACFLECCYTDPQSYVSGQPPVQFPPYVRDQDDSRGWIFEVRFQETLSVRYQLLAVFAHIDALWRSVFTSFFSGLPEEVELLVFHPDSTLHDLRGLIADYIRQRLEALGK